MKSDYFMAGLLLSCEGMWLATRRSTWHPIFATFPTL